MSSSIRLRKVCVHNLQSIDLDLPKRKLIGFCGPSGSGKSSVAIDTIFAEGQRRYLDTFSMAERGLFDQPEKPEAEEIESVPPVIAITRSNEKVSDRVTVGSMTELSHLLQTAVARFGKLVCQRCQIDITQHGPASTAEFVRNELTNERVMIGFNWDPNHSEYPRITDLVAHGFVRALLDGQIVRLGDLAKDASLERKLLDGDQPVPILIDRLQVSAETKSRLQESIGQAYREGNQECFVIWSNPNVGQISHSIQLDEKAFRIARFSAQSVCNQCGTYLTKLSANELSFNSPVGACSICEGLGKQDRFAINRLVTDEQESVAGGAIELLEDSQFEKLKAQVKVGLGDQFEVPWSTINDSSDRFAIDTLIRCIESFFHSSGSKKTRRLMEPYRETVACQSCDGARLNSNALSHHLNNQSLGDLCEMSIGELAEWTNQDSVKGIIDQDRFLTAEITSRLDYLQRVGLSYLTLGREVSSLSTGERQRVSMTNALGSKLVNMLYVFDEPCAGLHPMDVPQLVGALRSLSDQGNSVLAVDHELTLISALDHVTEFGPGAGIYGGKVTYSGDAPGLRDLDGSVTGDYLASRKSLGETQSQRAASQSGLRLFNARGNNLKNISVDFPLGVLSVVTGVSGSGKSSLVVDTLYPAIKQGLDSRPTTGLEIDSISGIEEIDDVVLIDQSPLGAASRSNPATYCKAFDAIRIVFSETVEARARNIKPGRFSFNTEGGRCEDCKGEGTKQIDMKFMANLRVKCKFCNGLRYKQEILHCRYRGQSISDVLDMTVREAFAFFRGQKKVQSKLKPLIDVGLDYLRLGQPASTLSSGESQRLRLAGFLSTGRKARTLFILDEPTVGLHYCDVSKLLDCFDALLAEGHSIILVEHNRMVMCAADHLIDLGPGPGEQGGEVVATGSPAEVAQNQISKTGAVVKVLLDECK